MSDKISVLSEGVQGLFIENVRFNTTLISFNFYLPLKEETVADNALLPFVLTTCGKNYPDFSKLNLKLNELYGAQLTASAEKVGDNQLLKMAVSVIDDRFALDNGRITESAISLLTDLLFCPKVKDNAFYEEDTEREKRKAIEHIRNEYSEKRIYAKTRLIEEMYKGTSYGVPKCGTEESVGKITGESLYKAWENLLKSAKIRVCVIAKQMPDGLFDELSNRFSSVKRENVYEPFNTPTVSCENVNEVTEYDDVKQGKLVMGFSSELGGKDEVALPLLVTTDIFGGGPYSRLFNNVREKMSLCYYCAASSVRIKGLVTVDSGIEVENAQKAQNEILNQLDIMKKGEFNDFEFESSVKSLKYSLNSYNDSEEALDLWYGMRIFEDSPRSPVTVAKMLDSVTREDVVNTAKGIKLHTVFKLLPKST